MPRPMLQQPAHNFACTQLSEASGFLSRFAIQYRDVAAQTRSRHCLCEHNRLCCAYPPELPVKFLHRHNKVEQAGSASTEVGAVEQATSGATTDDSRASRPKRARARFDYSILNGTSGNIGAFIQGKVQTVQLLTSSVISSFHLMPRPVDSQS